MRFHDSEWAEAHWKIIDPSQFAPDPRVDSDPDELRSSLFREWYVQAFRSLIDAYCEPLTPIPTDEDVRREMSDFVDRQMEHYGERDPELVGRVEHPDLFAHGIVSPELHDAIAAKYDRLSEVIDRKEAECREWVYSCRSSMERRIGFLGTHDAIVTVTRADGMIDMRCTGGLCVSKRIVFHDPEVVDGDLPDSFEGLYETCGREDGRYVIEFQHHVDGRLRVFTISARDVTLYNPAGMEIDDDYDHLDFFIWHRIADPDRWVRDEQCHTYRRKT
ncbi:hypothetical protein [Candidatus Methanoprimaticola sp. MG2]|uniref:hypothetical protein n=1 Tax=Candidatus Methanoprimaticola sp. MG2 TaxID=3228838 RepID=UPI0039C70B5B